MNSNSLWSTLSGMSPNQGKFIVLVSGVIFVISMIINARNTSAKRKDPSSGNIFITLIAALGFISAYVISVIGLFIAIQQPAYFMSKSNADIKVFIYMLAVPLIFVGYQGSVGERDGDKATLIQKICDKLLLPVGFLLGVPLFIAIVMLLALSNK